MNREIEFRVYDKDLKKMRYLNNCHDSIWFHEDGTGYYENMQTGPGEWFTSLMQYTGLKDKNGKKIFEGDIIDIHQTVNGYNQFVIIYNNYQFTAEYYNEKTKRRTHRFYEYDLDELFEINECEKEIEVIGNIYENNLESKGE
jgi:uncharacterized phage protein (TIGR01671 family)